jgi:Flp pilus assembly protein TadG
MRRLWKNSSGNTLIMVAISLATLAAFGVLAIDIGRMLVTKTQLQNAADASALAGASVFCENPAATDAEVEARARLLGAANEALVNEAVPVDMDAATITITRDAGGNAGDNQVYVQVNSNTAQYFLDVALVAMRQATQGVRSTLVDAEATAHCGPVCNVSCVKPWSPPDRWNDMSNVPGFANWNGNNQYDSEDWTDVNDNLTYDPGIDTYDDTNGNGQWDGEEYHPLLTGYVPDPYPGNSLAGANGDLGLQIMLKAGNDTKPVPGQYQPIDLPPINKGTPITGADQYRWNIANCNPQGIEQGDILQTEPGNMVGPTSQGMTDLIAQDPDAYWDGATQSVQASRFAVSPRIVLIPIHDPRWPIDSGRNLLKVTKVAAFFMERMQGKEVIGRFVKVRGPGDPCPAGSGASSFVSNLSLIQ